MLSSGKMTHNYHFPSVLCPKVIIILSLFIVFFFAVCVSFSYVCVCVYPVFEPVRRVAMGMGVDEDKNERNKWQTELQVSAVSFK